MPAGVRRHGGQVNLAQVYGGLHHAGRLLRLGYLDADVQLEAPVPDERTRARARRQVKRQDQWWAAFAHRQECPPFAGADGLCGPVDGVELLLTPGILHAHLGVFLAPPPRCLNVGEEGVDDHLHGLAVQVVSAFGGPLQLVPPRPLRMGHPCFLVRSHAAVPDAGRLLLCGLQSAKLARRQVVESIHAHGLHGTMIAWMS